MDPRPIIDGYTVSPQIQPSDVAALAAQGVKTIICNRPDAENPPHLQAAAMQAEAEAHGIAFVYNPFSGGMMTEDNVDEQAEAIAGSDGPVFAYCASGNRSTVVWAFGVAGAIPVDEIVARATKYGYQFEPLRPALEAAAARNAG